MSVERGYQCECPRDENVASQHYYSLCSHWQVYCLTVTDSTLHMVRQWCRIFANANRFVKRVKGEGEMLLKFFVERPVGAVERMCMRVCIYLCVFVHTCLCLCMLMYAYYVCLSTCVYFSNMHIRVQYSVPVCVFLSVYVCACACA